MTLGLPQILRLFASVFPLWTYSRAVPHIDLMTLSARDLADLNLPSDVSGKLGARCAAEELRRRTLL